MLKQVAGPLLPQRKNSRSSPTFLEFIFSRMSSKASSTSANPKTLRNRVRSYFHVSAKHNLRIKLDGVRIHDFSLIVTDTEAEALILEEQLIKRHHPRYNVAFKDGKSYPYCN